MGTDTVEALLFARRYYGADMAGFSVPAMEHSTVTSWGRDGEVASYRNMVKKNGKPGGIVSAVSDSYDIFEACRLWGTELKQDVIDSGATLVVRPDSGHPAAVVLRCLQILEEHFGHTINDKGFMVLNNVRVLQGDGIYIESVGEILDTIIAKGFSADNVVFGQGGALLQFVNRDDQQFAMKCSAAYINGEWINVFKDPITDTGKRSKKGLLKLVPVLIDYDKNGKRHYHHFTASSNESDFDGLPDALETVFLDGGIEGVQTFDEIRARASL